MVFRKLSYIECDYIHIYRIKFMIDIKIASFIIIK